MRRWQRTSRAQRPKPIVDEKEMKNTALYILLAIAAALPARAGEAPDKQAPEWKVGAASVCITPERPLPMAFSRSA